MASPRQPVLLIVGADRTCPTTVFAAALVHRLRVLGRRAVPLAPVITGCAHDADHDLWAPAIGLYVAACGAAVPPLLIAPYRFSGAQVPAAEAAAAGLDLTLTDLVATVHDAESHGDLVVIDGGSGALSPWSKDATVLDVGEAVHASIVVLATRSADAVSEVSLVLEACRRRALRIGGVCLLAEDGAPVPAREGEVESWVRVQAGAELLPTLAVSQIDAVSENTLDAVARQMADGGHAERLLEALRRP